MTPDSSVHLEILEALESIEAIVPEWYSLVERDPLSTPFQSPDWLLPWWKTWGGGLLRVLSVRHEERLVGLAPLYIHRWPDERLRRISWIGSGISDHLDLVSEPGFKETAVRAVLSYLQENQADWDIADLQELGEQSPLLNSHHSCSLNAKAFPSEPCPVCSLPGSMDLLRAQLSQSRRRSLVQASKNFKARGELSLKIASEIDLPSDLDHLFRFHEACWRRKRLPGVLGDPSLFAFHLGAAAAFQKNGCLRLYSLQLNGETIASLYAMTKGTRVYAYISGFDPQFEKFSPGSLLLNLVLEDSIRHGFSEFDFLRGAEAYKYAWGAVDRPNYRLALWHSERPISIGEKCELCFSE
jgi:CelD/BcsL family acetyltransferase involved in cellulose biosynthesis